MPSFSRCRPSSRVADPGPEAKVSHHFMLLGSKMMPLPSLRLCHCMCGFNPEPNLRIDLSPADAQFLPRPQVLPQQVGHAEVMPGQAQNLPGSHTSRPPKGPINGFPDAPGRPQQVGVAEVMPGQAQNLPGSRTSRPRVQPQQKGLADGWGQSRLQQMSPHLSA